MKNDATKIVYTSPRYMLSIIVTTYYEIIVNWEKVVSKILNCDIMFKWRVDGCNREKNII